MHNSIGVADFGPQVCEALGLDPNRVSRIIIDIDSQVSGPIKAYVEMLADERVLALDWAKGLTGAEIIREPRSG